MKLPSFNVFSPESKVKKLIKENLKMTLNDFNSYIPVDFGEIESVKTKYEDLWVYKRNMEEVDVFLNVANENTEASRHCSSTSKSKEYLEKSRESLERAEFHLRQVDNLKMKFVSEFVGWKMKHTFNSKNQNGIYEIHHYEFLFDKEFTRIIKTVDLSEK